MKMPEKWRRTTLGETATLQRGFDLPVGQRCPGTIPVVASNGPVGTHDEARVAGPGVVTGRSGTIGKVHFYEQDFWPLNTALYVRDFHGNDPRFVAFFLESLKLKRFVASTGVPSLNRNFVHPLPVDIPPFPEQRKIAAILSSVDATIEKTESVVEQLQIVKKAIMQELLTRGLPGRHTRFKKTEMGQVPQGWTNRRFGDVAERIRVPVEVVPTENYREIGVRSHAAGVFHKECVSGSDLGSKRVFWVQPNCLVLNIVFAWEGAVAGTSESETGMIASHRFPMFRPNPEVLDLQFFRLLMQSPQAVRRLGVLSPGGAGRNKTLNQSALLETEIPLPSNTEQKLIAETLSALEVHIEREKALRDHQQELKQGMMSVLLTGEVRITPDETIP